MIIFFNKDTGEIVGSIAGKTHSKEEAGFWVGDKETTERVLYTESAPHFKEAAKDPLFARKFKIDIVTGQLLPLAP